MASVNDILFGTPAPTPQIDEALGNETAEQKRVRELLMAQLGRSQNFDPGIAGIQGQQQSQVDALQRQARSEGAATMAARDQLRRQTAAIGSQAAGARGVTAGAAQRSAAAQQAALGVEGTRALGQVRAGEQAAAQNQIAGLLNQQLQGQLAGNQQDLAAQQQQLGILVQMGQMSAEEAQRRLAIAQMNAQLQAQQPGQAGILPGVITAGSTIAGALIGGPPGAVAGNAAGNALSPALTR